MGKYVEFYKVLNDGASSQNVAKSFVDEMMSKTTNSGPNSLTKVVYIFLKQLLEAVGLKFSLTVENLIDSKYDDLRQGNLLYIFAYDATKLNLANEFLTDLHHYLDKLEEKFQNSAVRGKSIKISPLINYAFVVFNWLEVCSEFFTEASCNDKCFREAFALLSFFILKSLAPLEHKYREAYPSLKIYTSSLSWVMSFGLLCRETHKDIRRGMRELFNSHQELFVIYVSEHWITFQRIVTCDMNNEKVLRALHFFKKIINKWSSTDIVGARIAFYLRELTSLLVSENLMTVYYNVITSCKSKKLLKIMLNFLNVLQSNLSSVEPFKKQFLIGVLLLVLEYDADVVRKKAAKFYSNIVHTQTDNNILAHILGVYAYIMTKKTKFLNLDYLDAYIDVLSKIFPMMNLMHPYIKVMTNTNLSALIRKLACKAVKSKFERQNKLNSRTTRGIDFGSAVKHLKSLMIEEEVEVAIEEVVSILT